MPNVSKAHIVEGLARWLRESPMMKRLYRWSTRRAMPFIVLLLSLLVVAGVIYRLAVHIPTVGDGVCQKWSIEPSKSRPNDDASGTKFGQPFPFDTATPCLDTGLKLYAGEKYTIRVRIVEDVGWHDASFRAGLRGLSHPLSRFHYIFALGIPTRRILSLPWFALTGEIGRDSANTFPIPESQIAFRPKTTGPLYLYVNDAINSLGKEIPINEKEKSSEWYANYLNNKGTAMITVTPDG